MSCQCPLDRWRSTRGSTVLCFTAGLPAGPFAGNPPLSARSALEERAQRKTGVGAFLHYAPFLALPLNLADCGKRTRLEGVCQQERHAKRNETSNNESAINILSQWEANARWHDALQSHAG